jgi:hypothetical protein
MLHAIQAPERVTPTPPRVAHPTPLAPTPAADGATAATRPEEPGPTFREFFFNHPGIRRTSSLSSLPV